MKTKIIGRIDMTRSMRYHADGTVVKLHDRMQEVPKHTIDRCNWCGCHTSVCTCIIDDDDDPDGILYDSNNNKY